MTPLLTRTLASLRRHEMLASGRRVLVALSGGADSVALLFVLRELAAAGELVVAGVAHLNHRLRGADADLDEAFCRALAERLSLPIVTERVDVASLAREEKRSIEDAARSARYEFLARAAQALGADSIAVAHTVEDQAETFLLRLIRGSGARGLAAIHPRAGQVIRPLLDVHRVELREYLDRIGEPFREDASNADVAFERNRVRHELLPLIRSRFSPRIDDVLAREASLARHDEEFLAAEAIKLAAGIVLTDVDIRIDAAGLAAAPRALSSRVVLAALQRFAGPRPITFDHVDRLLALAAEAAAGRGSALSLPGQDALRVGRSVVLRERSRARVRNPDARTCLAFPLSIPGEVELMGAGVIVETRYVPGDRPAGECPAEWTARGAEVGIAASAPVLPLGIRCRRPGDRFRPLGAPGRRKLQDFLVDRKVPREQRDTVPLVVDGRDRIVWVVGESVAEEFRVTDPSQGVILLKVRHLGGVG